MKKIVLMLSLAMIFSCKKEEKTEIKNLSDPIQLKTDSSNITDQQNVAFDLKLQTFGFPVEVDGCSCYFAKNKEDFEAEKYVYVDDYANNAFLKSGGKMIRIPMKKGDFDPQNFSKKIQNKDITVQIDGKKIKNLEEVMMFEGTMRVEYKNGEKTATPVYGECGC